ncbi:LysR family transcriptional regulator [Alcaligenaceae bacterium]|uniref:LysR family transcriptional regulator n=1 Tax=Parapusillimonas sp. JC17 TaxID=3445768 RepID=UPI0015D1909E|nr:LysR family transcriptional regulator [Alcaligenaceae bacterium]
MQRFATLKQLNALYITANAGSVTEAAKILHVTQPTVTLQIKQLEEAAGLPLFEKLGRGIVLTEAGRILTQHASRIIAQWHDASQDLEALRTKAQQTLRIGAIQTVEYLLPPLLIAFSEQDPSAKIELRIGQRDEVVKLLRERSVDMIILEDDTVDDEFDYQVFADHPMAFIASPQHALSHDGSFTLKEVVNSGLIVRETGASTRRVVEGIFKSHGTPFQFKSEFSSNVAIKRMVEANLAVGFVSLHACKVEIERHLIVPISSCRLQGWPHPQWCVITEKGAEHRPLARSFVDFLLTEGRAVTESYFGYQSALEQSGEPA